MNDSLMYCISYCYWILCWLVNRSINKVNNIRLLTDSMLLDWSFDRLNAGGFLRSRSQLVVPWRLVILIVVVAASVVLQLVLLLEDVELVAQLVTAGRGGQDAQAQHSLGHRQVQVVAN